MSTTRTWCTHFDISVEPSRDRLRRGHDVHRSIDQCSALRCRPDLFRSVAESMMWSRLRDHIIDSGGTPELSSGTTQRARGRVNYVAVPAPHEHVCVHQPIRHCLLQHCGSHISTGHDQRPRSRSTALSIERQRATRGFVTGRISPEPVCSPGRNSRSIADRRRNPG